MSHRNCRSGRGERRGALARLLLIAAILIIATASPAAAQEPDGENVLPAILESATFDQRLGEQAPLDLTFTDESGQPVHFSDYFGEKPVLLTMNYYDCVGLCPLVLDGVVRGLKGIPMTIGQEFNVVTVSIDPRETPGMAAEVKERLVAQYGREGTAANWHLLTGDKSTIDRLAEAVGFNYAWDEAGQQYAHPSGVMFLTPEGKMARYIYGIEFSPRDFRLALVEASENKIGSAVDRVLLFCYRYNPAIGQYSSIAVNVMRVAGLITVLGIAGVLVVMIRRERKQDVTTGMA